MNIVIIGVDADGLSKASRSKRNRPELRITLLEKWDDVSHSACGMPRDIANSQRHSMEDLAAIKELDQARVHQSSTVHGRVYESHVSPSPRGLEALPDGR